MEDHHPAHSNTTDPDSTHEKPTHENSSGWYKATIGRRLIALFIDGLILLVVEVLLMTVLPKNGEQNLSWIIGTIYAVGFIWQKGATPGKMAMKIKVVRTNGENVGFWQALLRESVGKLLSSLVFGLGYFWAFWDQNRQTWHDKIAGTYVVTKIPNDGKKSGCLIALVIAIAAIIPAIAIIAAVVVIMINPLELTRRARDAARLTDAATLQQSINTAVIEAQEEGAAENVLCVGGDGTGCTGRSDQDGATADGSGWVKVNLAHLKNSPLQSISNDPVNNNQFHYTYCSDGKDWEINFILESEQQKKKMTEDTGDRNDLYELGSNLTICK